MDPGSAILRVKRKRRTDPADALLLACKRVRAESGAPQAELEPANARIESTVFKLVATVASQDAPVQTHLRKALSRPRLAHALRPSRAGSGRILGDLRDRKWSARRDERYRILCSHRAGLLAEPPKEPAGVETEPEPRLGDVQVFDIIQEDDEVDEEVRDSQESAESDPETILCNSVKMMREKLSVSSRGAEHREKHNEYVYDLYYQETATPGWIQDILSVTPYTDQEELVSDAVVWEEDVYEDDDDDENAESNWRNDYPDEEESEEDDNERYRGVWGEEHSYSQRSWERYHRDMMKELEEEEDREESD